MMLSSLRGHFQAGRVCEVPSPMPSTQQVFLSGSPTLGTGMTAGPGGNQARDEEGMGMGGAWWGVGGGPDGMKIGDC